MKLRKIKTRYIRFYPHHIQYIHKHFHFPHKAYIKPCLETLLLLFFIFIPVFHSIWTRKIRDSVWVVSLAFWLLKSLERCLELTFKQQQIFVLKRSILINYHKFSLCFPLKFHPRQLLCCEGSNRKEKKKEGFDINLCVCVSAITIFIVGVNLKNRLNAVLQFQKDTKKVFHFFTFNFLECSTKASALRTDEAVWI